MSFPSCAAALAALLALSSTPRSLHAQIPHNQDRPPGPAVSPEEARQRMTVQEGFRVEIFASEPGIVNPVTMSFDEKGRVWITESLEYPRREAGPGRDRIKVLEDTDGDRKADTFTVFAEGLNIPCGVAVGNGGVYVTNSPDILFLQDTDGDGKADRTEVVLTGFGRFDTHELPNTLTWGPDGWLYGLNGVFNGAKVRNKGKEYRFDASLWRYHPRTRDFELFAEGTSNPWGVAWDPYGNAFVSACVIDHLYHLAETGYYHRQAGAYPPFTWKIESVVNHAHQKAAYCSLALYDAEVYPEKYRGRLYMGNIHGNCINVDRLERRGSTYETGGEPDLLSANDSWFMPVAIRLAPDGCFYVLDWYDRYHCYQDANRDPKGIDRLKGRLYRIAYGESPRAGKFDLASEPAPGLIERLASPNLWWRDEAKRVLAERIASGMDEKSAPVLKSIVLGGSNPKARVHALWTLVSAEDPGTEPKVLDADFHLKLLALADPTLRAWGVRAAGNSRLVHAGVRAKVRELAQDPSADVRLQVATAARKLFPDAEALPVLLATLAASEGDILIPHIVWRSLEPLLETQGAQLAAWASSSGEGIDGPAFEPLLGRITERLLARKDHGISAVTALAGPLLAKRKTSGRAAVSCLGALAKALQNGELSAPAVAALRAAIAGPVSEILSGSKDDPLYPSALTIAAGWHDVKALDEASRLLLDPQEQPARRTWALRAVLASRDAAAIEAAAAILKSPEASGDLVRDVLAGLGKLDSPAVPAAVLGALEGMPLALKSQAADLLTQRPAWAEALLDAVESKRIERASLSLNQARRILSLKDEGLSKRVAEVWGQIRSERNPEREKVMATMRKVIEEKRGNPWDGKAVFEKTCAKCHTLFGKGATVGPDITVNGRETLDALLTSLLDPNLVIGAGYQAWTLLTKSGRALTGLLVEDSPQRVVLKVEGGNEEIIPRDDAGTLERSEVSMMPEDLEKTLKEDELRDLIAYLRYDEAPPDPVETAREGNRPAAERPLIVAQTYGTVTVSGRFPFNLRQAGGSAPGELLRYEHSSDLRPFIHPLREARDGVVLSALRPDDHPWQYGIFTGHARVNGVDFWHEKGWIRSRGLESVRDLDDTVEIVSKSDWLTQRRGGKRLLAETQRIVVHAPDSKVGDYRIDFEWRLTPDEDVTFGQYEYGGLAFRPASHADRRHEHADGKDGYAWQDMSGRFKHGSHEETAGVAILDHPKNPGFPNAWRVDGEGLINPAISARGPLSLAAGKTAVFRYRIVVHEGHGDKKMLDEEFRQWVEESR